MIPKNPHDFVQWANAQHKDRVPDLVPAIICLPWLYESTGEEWSVSFFGHVVWDSEGDEGQSSEDALEAAAEIAQNAAAWIEHCTNCGARRQESPSAQAAQALSMALRDALAWVERNHCDHDVTHCDGAIWEMDVCDGCGAKWATAEGGKPAGAGDLPREIQVAQAVLCAFDRDADEGQWPTTVQAAQALAEAHRPETKLWAVHYQGSDGIVAMPSLEAAERAKAAMDARGDLDAVENPYFPVMGTVGSATFRLVSPTVSQIG